MGKFKKNEMLLIFGKWTTYIGNIVFDYANSVSIVHLFTNSPQMLSLYQSSETLVQILFNLIGGVTADSRNRKKILVTTDFVAAVICFALSFCVRTKFVAEALILTNIVLAFVYSFNSPTYKSIIREVIEKERIGFFNSIINGGTEVLQIAGPIISFFLVDQIGVRGAMLFNSATFLSSAVCEMKLTSIYPSIQEREDKISVFANIRDGFVYLFQEKQVFYLVLLSAFVNFFLAGYNLIIPFTDIIYEELFRGFYSKALMMQALGGIIGSFISAKLSAKVTENVKTPIVFLGITGLCLLLEPLAAETCNFYLCLLPFAGFGAALTIFNIQFMSCVQIRVEEDYLGRVFSIIFTVAVFFMPIGSFVFPAICDATDVRSFYLIGGGITFLTVVFFLAFRSKRRELC